MKGVAGLASLVVGALASKDIGPYSYSATKTSTIYDKSNMKWTILSYTAYNEDTGEEFFRLEHTLDADIQATDEVIFELAYTMQNDEWTNKLVIAEDVSVCKIS